MINEVTIKVEDLLKILEENKLKHVASFEEAMREYNELLVITAEENLRLATQGGVGVEKLLSWPRKPSSYESEYSKAIRMLMLSTEDEMTLNAQTFDELVMDQWGWKSMYDGTITSNKIAYGNITASKLVV